MVYAESIEEVKHPQHSFIGYAEICGVASQNEIKQGRELFAKNTDPMPTTLSILRLYNALNETGRQNFVKECIHPDDQTVVSISIRVFRAVDKSGIEKYRAGEVNGYGDWRHISRPKCCWLAFYQRYSGKLALHGRITCARTLFTKARSPHRLEGIEDCEEVHPDCEIVRGRFWGMDYQGVCSEVNGKDLQFCVDVAEIHRVVCIE